MKESKLKISVLLILAASLTACSSAEKSGDTEARESKENLAQMSEAIQKLSARIDEMDTKVVSMNEKVDAHHTAINSYFQVKEAKATPVGEVAIRSRGTPPDPESGFSQTDAVIQFRSAKILFDAEKYNESILKFADFLKLHADHPLASSAQFYVGESYFRLKEFKLARKEFQGLIVSYDRSSYVPDSLAKLTEIERQLNMGEEAEKHTHALHSLFPHSPASEWVAKATPTQHVPKDGESVESAATVNEPTAVEHTSGDATENQAAPTAPIEPMGEDPASGEAPQ